MALRGKQKRDIVRKFRLGEDATAQLPDPKSIGTVKATVQVSGTIIGLSPDRRFAKLLLSATDNSHHIDDDTELLIETRFLK